MARWQWKKTFPSAKISRRCEKHVSCNLPINVNYKEQQAEKGIRTSKRVVRALNDIRSARSAERSQVTGQGLPL